MHWHVRPCIPVGSNSTWRALESTCPSRRAWSLSAETSAPLATPQTYTVEGLGFRVVRGYGMLDMLSASRILASPRLLDKNPA